MNFFGRKVLGAIQRQEVTIIQKHQLFQDFPTLGLAKDSRKDRGQFLRLDLIQDDPHLGITGHHADVIDGLEIREFRLVVPALIKRQQGRIFQGKHGKPGREGISHGNLDLTVTQIRNLFKLSMDLVKQAIRIEMLSNHNFGLTHIPPFLSIHGRKNLEKSRHSFVNMEKRLRKGKEILLPIEAFWGRAGTAVFDMTVRACPFNGLLVL